MKLNQLLMLLVLAVSFFSCNKRADKDDFCLYVNAAYIDETIPMVNEFLAGLSNDLDREQQLQALAQWFKSKPCIIDAVVSNQGLLTISFDEDGIIKEFFLYYSLNPLKATYYSQGFDDCKDVQPTFLKGTTWKLAGFVDIQTGELRKLEPEDCEACFTLSFDTDYKFTVIYIGSRWKFDLCNLKPPDALSYIYKCEPYDKDGKEYSNSYADFDAALLTISSYSVNNDELKLFCNFGRSYMSFIPHYGENPSTSRIGATWNLLGVVDVQSGELKVLKPQSNSSYTILFRGDYLARIVSINTHTEYNILNMERFVDYSHHPCWPEQFKYVDYWTAEYDKDNGEDSYLFRYAIDHVKEYLFTHDELKLFFEYQGKDYYLIFKLTFR